MSGTSGLPATRLLARHFAATEPAQAAAVCDSVAPERVAVFLAGEPARDAARLLAHLSTTASTELLGRLGDETLRAVLPELEPDVAAAMLARLPDDVRERCLGLASEGLRAELEGLLSWPAESAGRLMDPRVTSFRAETPAGEVAAWLRARPRKEVRDVFVVDAKGALAGAVPLLELLLAPPEQPLGGLAHGPVPQVQAIASREEVVELLERGGLRSLPVVDFQGRLLGVLRQDELVEAAQREATADLVTMVGASESERALSPTSFAVKKRLPWLQINLLTAFLAASVVGLFEDTIARYTALAVLLPVVAGQSGNTGAQALAVTMRGLALREVRVRQWLRVSGKETLVGAVNGIAVALTTSLGVWVWSRSLGLALVIGISMVISMTAAGLSGALIPMLLTAVRQDPAQSSSIILTTVTDVVGFFSFLGIATLLSGML